MTLVVHTVRFVANIQDNVNVVLMLEDEHVTGRVTIFGFYTSI